MRRLFLDPGAPQRDAIDEAAKWIRAGRVVAIPTDTLYGLAADPFQEDAVQRLFAIKGRSAERALPLIAADRAQVVEWLGPLTPLGTRLADRFWPGPLTLLVRRPSALAPSVTGGLDTVGVRVPDHRVARDICRAAGRPVTATSANLSGQPATASPDDVEEALGPQLDVLVDAGRTAGGAPSTIVDVTGASARIVRAGAIASEEIASCLRAG